MPNIHTTAPLQLTEAPLEVTPARIDVEIAGLRHGGASFEVRLFLDNAEADVDTPPTTRAGARPVSPASSQPRDTTPSSSAACTRSWRRSGA